MNEYKDEEFIKNDIPPYHTQNNTIIIESGLVYLFNVVISSVVVIGVLSGCCKVGAMLRKRINEYQQSRILTNYLLSHQADEEGTGEACSICMDLFTSTQTNSILQCNHKFHSQCIREWLEKELTCPLCRLPIVLTN